MRRTYNGHFSLNMKIKSAILFGDRQRRSQFEHDHRRRADRAPQIRLVSRKTGDGLTGRIEEEAWTGPNRRRNGRESGVRIQAGGGGLGRDNAVRRQALTAHSVRKCN